MKYRPEGNKVIIEADEVGERTESGRLIITQQAQEENQRRATVGTVIAIGPDVGAGFDREGDGNKSPLEVGDHIVFSKYGGFSISEPGKDIRVILDDDIIALVE